MLSYQKSQPLVKAICDRHGVPCKRNPTPSLLAILVPNSQPHPFFCPSPFLSSYAHSFSLAYLALTGLLLSCLISTDIKHNVFWRLKKLTDIMVGTASMRKYPVAYEKASDQPEK